MMPTTFRTASAHSPELPLHLAEELTGGGAQALIQLGDQIYTLRITRQGKLILTK
ncbi:hemin uptake protein HemP [Donghicola tyrosinivorans]|nr:hemin uptake protein HemP [Donghicola tyrosinivorans]MEC9197254.1 hemin uptake protein HemP [Pseudomonadota bacterium]MEE3070658.1 hemin uptake protein HemP [Pseudomonadota bacterium]